MRIISCLHTDSKCYKAGEKARQTGIVVHSTGANNPYLRRYVQPSKGANDRGELLSVIGTNSNGNHWNRGVNKAVHYMIGKLSDGSVATAQTLPEDISAWGVGKGKKGSYNYAPTSHIQIEICEDGLSDKAYFKAVYDELLSLCADICRRNSLDPDTVVSHKEAYKKGYASNHKDIDHWLKKHGKSMKGLRAEIAAVLKGEQGERYVFHTVKQGESLWGIAKKYYGKGIKYTVIKKLNGMTGNRIYAGQRLIVKDNGSAF